mmetsp:Transcript_12943/g.43875  ORF Transcript_12943/g.43875 Transcript_12943/m.43875 type:complete len:226 (-) Transcript_12943:209-886(-)
MAPLRNCARLLQLAVACAPAPSVAYSGPLAQRVGTHLVIELWDVSAKVLNDETALGAALRAASERAGLQVLGSAFHRFEPQGVTGLLLLSESHISIHTWPELGYAAVDLFSCGARKELPCGESAGRTGGGGEVTMHMNLTWAEAPGSGSVRSWVCADGSVPSSPVEGATVGLPILPAARTSAGEGELKDLWLKDLWLAVDHVVEAVKPGRVRLRRFERGIPAVEI